MAVCRFASLVDGLYEDWLDDPVFRPIVDQDLAYGQHRNPDPAGRPEFFTTAYFHTPDGLAEEVEQAGFTGVTARQAACDDAVQRALLNLVPGVTSLAPR